MTPQPSAPAITIMRRLYAGLTGILPEIDEILNSMKAHQMRNMK